MNNRHVHFPLTTICMLLGCPNFEDIWCKHFSVVYVFYWDVPTWRISDTHLVFLLRESCFKASAIRTSLILLKKLLFITYSSVSYPTFIFGSIALIFRLNFLIFLVSGCSHYLYFYNSSVAWNDLLFGDVPLRNYSLVCPSLLFVYCTSRNTHSFIE